jgi:ComF family protein
MITKKLKVLQRDFVDLFYPRPCPSCGVPLGSNEAWLCTTCMLDMPESDYWKQQDNPVNQLFWGRVDVEFASAYLLFSKGSKYRELIHQLKYKGKTENGENLGALYGQLIAMNSKYPKIDCILPVPLHPKKQRKRGYNQSECIAKGLSKSLSVPYYNDVLLRVVHTTTQTKKSKDERWENVKNAFDINNTSKIEGKHVLLVDDVITTGATIEHCATTIKETVNCRLSIACLARA